MQYLIGGTFLFFLAHSISMISEKWRNERAQNWGVLRWKAVYSLVSIVGFVLICWGYGLARQNPITLFDPHPYTRYFSIFLMLPVFPLFLAASVPGKIKTRFKHPLLTATKIWAFCHLISNGTLADTILFGSFLVWAILNRISMKKREQRPILNAPDFKYNDIVIVAFGLAIYASFILWIHQALFSVPVLY